MASAFSSSTQIVLRELASGEVLAMPVMGSKFASLGSVEDAILEQEMFLAAYLGAARPEVVLRFVLPAETRLHKTRFVVPREDLPRRMTMTAPIPFTSVVVPVREASGGFWVTVLGLDHTFRVAPNEELDAAIRTEVLRLVAAQELAPLGYLGLLGGVDDRLETIPIALDRGADRPLGRTGALYKQLEVHEKRRLAAQVLASVAERRVAETDGRPVVGREAELALLGPMLGSAERQSVLLVGRERVGKSALVRAWLATQPGDTARPVFATSGAELVAGMSGLGQWQERVRRVLDAAELLNAVLWFDDMGDLFTDRASSSIDMPAAMKSWIEERKVSVVGEVRPEQLAAAEARHAGFLASFARVKVAPLESSQSLEALSAVAASDARRDPASPRVLPTGLAAIVNLAERYLPYEALPGKVVRVYDDLRLSAPPRATLGPDDVFRAFSARTGVPAMLLREERALERDEVLRALARKLVGQEEALARVADVVCVVKAGLAPTGKPLATLLFVGPTGVGKTELARALAELLFQSPDRMVRFDMSEYADAAAAERLVRGTARGDGLLTRAVREQPFGLVLLDEIEKAHPAVFDLLLQVCGEGRLSDARGKTAYFHNTIVVMTSNLGVAERRPPVGFESERASDAAYYTRAVRAAFRPEFVNRLDRIVAFRSLGREELIRVARLAVARVASRRAFTENAVELVVSEAALAHLAEGGTSETYGARGMRRHIEEHLTAPLARVFAYHGSLHNQVFHVTRASEPAPEPALNPIEAGGLRFSPVRRPVPPLQWQAMRQVALARREAERRLMIDRVAQIKRDLDFAVTELAAGARPKNPQASAEHAELQRRHHALSTTWTELSSLAAALRDVEDAALDDFHASNSLEGHVAAAESATRAFRLALVRALVQADARTTQVTLLVQETDGNRALDHWLAPLLGELARRSWEFEAHLHGGDREGYPDWPEDRAWGPPRNAAWLADHLTGSERPFSALLLRVRGPLAGAWLRLEAGIHRYKGVGRGGEPAHLRISRTALRTFIADDEWASIVPAMGGVTEGVKAMREYETSEQKLYVCSRAASLKLPLRDYWARYEEIALEHLILLESDEETHGSRDDLAVTTLEDRWDDIVALAKGDQLIQAIKLYRERTGVGLVEAKRAVEAMRGR